jgi:hypothetical protein
VKKPTISNIKFELLSKLLDLSRWQTVGLLETLWLFAQHHAYDGDLTRFSPKMIAAWFGWVDEPELLIDALVEAGWIDRGEERLVVHDWAEHAPNWVKGALKTTLQSSEKRDALSGTLSTPLSGTLLRKGKVRKGKASKSDAKSTVGIPEGLPPETWQAWLAARKAKKLCEPTTAILTRVEREAAKIGWTLAQAIQEAAERGWGGFDAAWVSSGKRTDPLEKNTAQHPHSPQTPATKIGGYVRKPKPGWAGA